jgi:cardiolipin synthase
VARPFGMLQALAIRMYRAYGITHTMSSWQGIAFAACLAGCGAAPGHEAAADGGLSASVDGGGGGPDGSAPSGTGDAEPPPKGDAGTSGGSDASPPPKGDGGLGTGSNAIQILIEPNGNRAGELVAAINAAQSSVHMTMYLLDSATIIAALEARSKAGVDVRVILNDFSKQTGSGDNTAVYNQLKAAGVKVVLSDATRFTFTHEKCVVIDGATAWIMTMNLETSSPEYNREYLVIDTEAADVAEAEQIFEADYADQPITASGSLVVAPEPPNNARTALAALVASAKSSLDIEAEEFSDFGSQGPQGSGVVPAVAAAASRGVKVRLVLAQGSTSSSQAQAVSQVKAAGASVVVSGGTSGASTASNPYIHAKAILVDCATGTCAAGYLGSENFTGGSLGYNRELGIVTTNGAALGPVEATIAADFAAGTAQ